MHLIFCLISALTEENKRIRGDFYNFHTHIFRAYFNTNAKIFEDFYFTQLVSIS